MDKWLNWSRCTVLSVQKNYCWIWIAVDRLGKKIINFVVGDKGNKTAKRLWDKIKYHEMNKIATDYWKLYEHIISSEKHVQSKAETFTAEGYNSLFRHFLARMRRKSKCYSKKIDANAEIIHSFTHPL